MALERELETYKKKLHELECEEGKFVLIQGNDIVGIYIAYEDALNAGYTKFGAETPFLVKQIQSIENIQLISRTIDSSCHT